MSYRRGLLWISRKTLMVQTNSNCNAASPMLQRGSGYRLPLDSSFARLALNNNDDDPETDTPVTAAEIIDGINLFYDQGIHPHSICFGGGYSEPAASFPAVREAMESLRETRHGVPLVVMTNGLKHEDYPNGDVAEELISMHEEWRDAPGSDGDSKMSVWCSIAASNPKLYENIMQPTNTKAGFQEMAGFVARLAEAGVSVYGTGSEHPLIVDKINQVKSMALGMGCSDFFVRTYHDQTLYNVLDVKEDSDNATIKAAYLKKAKELHPDVVSEEQRDECQELMSQVTEAHAVLMDATLRKKYDAGVADLVLNEHETDYFASIVNKSM